MKDFLKNFIKNTYLIDAVIIVASVILLSFFTSNHISMIFPDRGRELIFPQAILNGYVPYKDICMIYFPLSYHINALIFKFLGVSINSLLITQTFLCSVFVYIFYLLSREFLSRKLSVGLTFLVITSCIFARSDIFNYILPYSFGRVYGLFGFWGCVYSIIKLFKTDKIFYAYIAAFFAGFSISCKLEFLSVPFLLIFGLILYKKLKLSQYLKILGIFLIFPIISITSVALSGASWQNITDTINFCIKFSGTPSMVKHLGREGMYPIPLLEKIYQVAQSVPTLITLTLLCFTGLFWEKKFNKKRYLIYSILIAVGLYFENFDTLTCWHWLPITVLICFCLFFKKIIFDKALLFFFVAALISSQREFFGLVLHSYGTFSFPLLIVAMFIIIDRFSPKEIHGIKVEKLLSVITLLLIILYSLNLYVTYKKNNFATITKYGTFYTDYNTMEILDYTTKYIKTYTNKNDSVLVLPEGNIINFITDRKVDLKCFMMDRLYYDAYGASKATELIKNTNSDYIIIVKDLTNDFFYPYLYNYDSSPAARYIYENYSVEKDFISGEYRGKILKKKQKNKK